MIIDYGSLGRLGLMLPSVNQAAEPQLRAMLPAGVSISTTRLELTTTSEAALLGMAANIEPAARLLADAKVDLIVFHCTAVTTYDIALEASILSRIEAATGIKAMATSQALVASLQALGAKRIVMLSPYPDAINQREQRFFEARGFTVIGSAGRDCTTGPMMMAVTPQDWLDMASAHANDEADAYVLSCTTVRTAEVVEAVEARLGRPVVTSNTAVAWHSMQILEVRQAVRGFGQLLGRQAER